LRGQLGRIPGIADLRLQQAFDYPEIDVDVDRVKASQLGLTQRDVASNLLILLSGSFQTSPTFWVEPQSCVQYNITTQSPQYRLQSMNDLGLTQVAADGGKPQLLMNLAAFSRSVSPAVVSHYNVQPTLDIFAAVQDTDLGSVAEEVRRVVAGMKAQLPKGAIVEIRGQVETMNSSFSGLLAGLAFAIVLVYLLIVINFQSWLDPFIIITALPAALAGIVWMLFVTHTTISVPALTGAIMCMGVATANSVLIVSFARELMHSGQDAPAAALESGFTRFRPVLMTALAMIIGMIPMALGWGDGGEQNAPLGRAVIGGLVFATLATLLFVPTVFALIHGRAPAISPSAH
jgi:multidrug efflux pump subunit AcrB